jgi:nucleoside-diphosphate-sugar epimerase
MLVLVTGGTGFLGQHIARALLAQGDTPIILGRDFRDVQPLLHAGARALPLDMRDAATLADVCATADAVCHAGALSAAWGPWADFYAANVRATAAVVAGCQRGGARLVYISSPSVIFTGHDHHNLTEDAPYPRRFASLYSRSKKLGEDLVNGAAGLHAVILRPKAIFGPGDRSLLPRILAAARAGRLRQIGDGQNIVDVTYVENVADAVLLALRSPAATGGTYTITNGEHIRLWDLIRVVLRRLGIPADLRAVPLRVALAAATLMELRGHLIGREPMLTRYSTAILGRTQTYDLRRAQRDLAYHPRISVAEGVERTLQALAK